MYMNEKYRFAHGITYAVARLVEMYDQPLMALEILKSAGLSNEELKSCAESDLSILRKEIPGLPKGV